MTTSPVNEDRNREGYYWSFLVERTDIGGTVNTVPIRNMCPFAPELKKFIEEVLRRATYEVVDSLKIRNYSKLETILYALMGKLCIMNFAPAIDDIEIFGDPKGIRVLIILGEGYNVDPQWSIYNDHTSSVIAKYRSIGTEEFIGMLRAIMDEHLKEPVVAPPPEKEAPVEIIPPATTGVTLPPDVRPDKEPKETVSTPAAEQAAGIKEAEKPIDKPAAE